MSLKVVWGKYVFSGGGQKYFFNIIDKESD